MRFLIHRPDEPKHMARLSFWQSFKVETLFINDVHSIGHFGMSLLGVVVFNCIIHNTLNSFWCALIIGILWEFSDAFKKGYWTIPKGTPEWKARLEYSDGFSYSDIIYDLSGSLSGIFIINLLNMVCAIWS